MEGIRQTLTTGEGLYRQGDPGTCAYLIESGEVEVWTERAGRRDVLARVGAGDVVGELALVAAGARLANVSAASEVTVRRITADDLVEDIDGFEPALRAVVQSLIARCKDLLAHVPVSKIRPLPLGTGARLVDAADNVVLREDEAELQRELEHAVLREQFLLYFQPIMRQADETVAGFEALLRWRKPGTGVVSPQQFLPVAERSRLIFEIGHWTIDAVCSSLSQLQQEADRSQPQGAPLVMGINISPRQFDDALFFQQLDRAMTRHKVMPAQLRLELTESNVLANWDSAVTFCKRAKAMGVKLAIDGFGGGQSSLAYLHKLPVDTIKLSRDFISDMAVNSAKRMIVSAVSNLAHDLHLDFVAEGVEQRNQGDALKDLPLEFVQGFYFGQPMPLAVASNFIRRRPSSRSGRIFRSGLDVTIPEIPVVPTKKAASL